MKTQKESNFKITFVAGLALFSMFFGAGNLIFPPLLGYRTGSHYGEATIGFLMTTVGIVMVASIASTNCGGSILRFSEKVGRRFSVVFGTIVVLAIGPVLAIPRTAATTYEIVHGTLWPDLSAALCSAIFFGLVLFFVLNPKNIIDILGAYLTPILIIILALILIAGFSNPIGEIADTNFEGAFAVSFIEGYQTMDALAALIFMTIVSEGLRAKGIVQQENLLKTTIRAAAIAGIGLAVVYSGLLYIGATASGCSLGSIDRVELLIWITDELLGNFGKVALSLAITLACLTTAIGLTSTVGSFFEEISHGRLKQTPVILISTLFSAILAISGVEKIVAFAGVLLSLLYPVAMVLIFLNLFPRSFTNPATYKGAVLGAFIPALMDFLMKCGVPMPLLENLAEQNQAAYTFIWVVPAFIFALFATQLHPQHIGELAASLPLDPGDLVGRGWSDITLPEEREHGHYSYRSDDKELLLHFDKIGNRGPDHYHIENPYPNSKSYYYFDKDGNASGRGKISSQIRALTDMELSLEELVKRCYMHDSSFIGIHPNPEKKTVEMDIDFCYWMQEDYDPRDPENGILQLIFNGVSAYDDAGEFANDDFAGILDMYEKNGEICFLMLHSAPGKTPYCYTIRVKAESVTVKNVHVFEPESAKA